MDQNMSIEDLELLLSVYVDMGCEEMVDQFWSWFSHQSR